MTKRLPGLDVLLVIACMGGLVMYYLHIIPPAQADLVLGILAFIGLLPVAVSAGKAVINLHVTVDLLASVALLFSLLNQEWTSAVFINLMLASARIFAAYTQDSIREALKYLIKLRPQQARVKVGAEFTVVKISQVQPGDHVMVELGEQVPVDGTIVEGEASIDQSSFTGESLPVDRKVGDKVLESTIVLNGSLEIVAEKVGADSAFAHVVKLVESAQNNKARITTMADRFAGIYILVILIVASVIYFATGNLNLVLSVLLVVCADDIAVAIPLTMTAALAYAARNGVIIKGANFLEGLGQVRTLIMDKTGTLTQGHLQVAKFIPFTENYTEPELLQIAAGLAGLSQHPVSKSISEFVQAQKLIPAVLAESSVVGGQGVVASYLGKQAFLGRPSYLAKLGIAAVPEHQTEITKLAQSGFNVTAVSYGDELVGVFTLNDDLKPEAAEAIAQLKSQKVTDIVMLTGDNETIAEQISRRAGIPHYQANLLPEDKLAFLRSRLAKAGKLAMVGDGVNDAPALALADIGIAMGAVGSDVAIESADIVIMRDNLLKIPQTTSLAQDVARIAKQNFAYWGLSNVVGLILVFGGILTPAGAAAYNFITDFVPILNAMRVLRSRAYENSRK